MAPRWFAVSLRNAVMFVSGGVIGILVSELGFLSRTPKLTRHAKEEKETLLLDQPVEAGRPRVFCFGDSITQYGFEVARAGWVAHLQDWYQRRFDVQNRGFGGYNSRWGLLMLQRLLPPAPPPPHPNTRPVRLVTIFWGANDAVVPEALQYVPIQEYRSNLAAMVDYVRTAHPGAAVIFITPPPVHIGKWSQHRAKQGRPMDRELARTAEYAEAVIELGADMDVPVVDAYAALGGGDQTLAEEHLHDGVHLSTSGNKLLFRALEQTILAQLRHLDPAAIQMQAPGWAEVDMTNLASILDRL